MIPPNPEELIVITDPNDIPRVETECFYVAVRATYLGRLWELKIDTKSRSAALSVVTKNEASSSEFINTVKYIADGLPPIDIVGLAGMATYIQVLVGQISHKTFTLEGDAKNVA
jgi:hypothetical protein